MDARAKRIQLEHELEMLRAAAEEMEIFGRSLETAEDYIASCHLPTGKALAGEALDDPVNEAVGGTDPE